MINNFITDILPSIEHFQHWGYWLAFFSALLETTIGIGLFLPGSTIILFLGALSARGYFDWGDLVWFAVLGAILGDNINYYLGRKYGAGWIDRGFWFLKPDYIEKTKNFMTNHGSKSVFLGRFIPSVKEVIPFIAGSLEMNKKTFMLWNVLGAVGWGFEWIFAGYFFAQSLNLAELWLSRAGLFFAFVLVSSATLYFVKQLIVKKGKQILIIAGSLWQSISRALLNNEYVSSWVQKYPRSVSFLRARLNTKAFSGLTLSILTLAFVYVLALFAGIVEDLITSDPIVAIDIHIANFFVVFRNEMLTDIFLWITLLGKKEVILCFVAISASLLWLWRKNYQVLSLLVAVVGGGTFTCLGKLAFHRSRPELAVYQEHSFSFPSGHATIAVAFYGFIGYILIRLVESWSGKINIFFMTVFIIAAIGFSRIYLGVHYISDVWSGYLVGTMWLILAVSFSEWLDSKKRTEKNVSSRYGARPISFFLVFLGMIFYVLFSINYHPPQAAVPITPPVVISNSLDIFTSEQIKFSESLLGERQEPVNFIFIAEDDRHVTAALGQAGWILVDKANMSSFREVIKALILKKTYPAVPVALSFWNTKIQDLSFAKIPEKNWLNNAHHLKIWRTNYLLKNGNHIYLGLTNAYEGLKWKIIPRNSPDLDGERKLLCSDLNHTKKIKDKLEVQLVKPLIGTNFMGDQFFTDGRACIVTLR